MKFAFIIMGNFSSEEDQSEIHGGEARMIGVGSVEEACTVAQKLREEGIGCIELCGAFGEEGARKVIETTNHTLPVGYVIHLPEQDPLFKKAFS